MNPYPALTPEEIPAFRVAIKEALESKKERYSSTQVAEEFQKMREKALKAIAKREAHRLKAG